MCIVLQCVLHTTCDALADCHDDSSFVNVSLADRRHLRTRNFRSGAGGQGCSMPSSTTTRSPVAGATCAKAAYFKSDKAADPNPGSDSRRLVQRMGSGRLDPVRPANSSPDCYIGAVFCLQSVSNRRWPDRQLGCGRISTFPGLSGRPKVLLFALAAVIAYSVGNSVAANADSGLFMRRVQIAFCAQSVAIMGLTSARYI
jgi:hypothetical protein